MRAVRLGLGAVLVALLLFGGTQTAHAQYVGGTPPPVGGRDVTVLGVSGTQLPGPSAQVLGVSPRAQVLDVSQRAPVGGRLALTGGDIAGLVLLALGAVTTGVVLVRAGRSHRSATA